MTINIVLEKEERIVLPGWLDDDEWIFTREKNSQGVLFFHLINAKTGDYCTSNEACSAYVAVMRMRAMIEENRRTKEEKDHV